MAASAASLSRCSCAGARAQLAVRLAPVAVFLGRDPPLPVTVSSLQRSCRSLRRWTRREAPNSRGPLRERAVCAARPPSPSRTESEAQSATRHPRRRRLCRFAPWLLPQLIVQRRAQRIRLPGAESPLTSACMRPQFLPSNVKPGRPAALRYQCADLPAASCATQTRGKSPAPATQGELS
jgi:hypothetical protein